MTVQCRLFENHTDHIWNLSLQNDSYFGFKLFSYDKKDIQNIENPVPWDVSYNYLLSHNEKRNTGTVEDRYCEFEGVFSIRSLKQSLNGILISDIYAETVLSSASYGL